jgi:predicted flap endonuclease-1-like 5' DNA nuclease
MNETNGGLFSCRNTCWIAGGLLGLVAFLLIGGFWGLIVGIVVAGAIALLLLRLFCTGPDAAETHADAIARAVSVSSGAGSSDALQHDEEDEAAAESAASAMTGDVEAASGIAAEGARYTPAAALDAAAVREEAPAQAKPARAPVSKDGRPELFDTPQGAADDLKQLKGVGPKLEQTLNALGIWHYSQIAGWRKKEIEWVDSQLKFKGRIARDEWIKQAKALAKGKSET